MHFHSISGMCVCVHDTKVEGHSNQCCQLKSSPLSWLTEGETGSAMRRGWTQLILWPALHMYVCMSVWVYICMSVCVSFHEEKTWLNRLMVMFGIRSKSNLDIVVAWFTSYLLFYWACSPSREEIVTNCIFWHLELYNTLTKLCLCTFSSIAIIKEKNSTGRIRSLLHFNVVKMFWCLITSLFLHFSFLIQASKS